MKMSKYSVIAGISAVGVIALIAACSDPDPPHLDSISIETTSESSGTGLTYVREATDPNLIYADPTKGVYLGNGLSVILGTYRVISNLPDSQADDDRLLKSNLVMTVQGDCVSTENVTGSYERVIVNTVHDGDCQVTFAVNGAQGVVVMPVHVVDQDKIPANVYPPDLPPPEAGPDADADETSVSTADDGGSDAGADADLPSTGH